MLVRVALSGKVLGFVFLCFYVFQRGLRRSFLAHFFFSFPFRKYRELLTKWHTTQLFQFLRYTGSALYSMLVQIILPPPSCHISINSRSKVRGFFFMCLHG